MLDETGLDAMERESGGETLLEEDWSKPPVVFAMFAPTAMSAVPLPELLPLLFGAMTAANLWTHERIQED